MFNPFQKPSTKEEDREEEFEKDLDELTPMRELKQDLIDLKKYVFVYASIATILSFFLSGFLYQFFTNIVRGETIYILASFKYGITKTFVLSLLILFVFLFGGYRIYRSFKRNYLMNYKDNYKVSKTETFGGAHFQSEEELKCNFDIKESIDETDGHVFGTDKEGKIYSFLYQQGMNYNDFYCGAPGSGKSASIIKTKIYQSIKRGDSLVVTDSKGDLYAQTSAVAKAHGYKIRIFDIKPGEFKNSDAFNFFSSISESDEDLDSKADVLAKIIINTTTIPGKANAYFDNNELNLLKCIILHIALSPAYRESGRSTLPEMYNYLSSRTIDEITNDMMQYPNGTPIRLCFNLFNAAKDVEKGNILNGLGIRLSVITNKSLQQVLSHNEIDPIEPMHKKCIYYVIMSDTTDTYKLLSALFFSHMIRTQVEHYDALTSKKRKDVKQIFYLLDEYYATGGVYGMDKLIAVVRSRRIGITIIVQDIGQLNSLYKDEDVVASILNCCCVKGLLSTNDTKTAEYFATLLGSQTVISESQRYSEASSDIVHSRQTVQKTQAENKRNLMNLEDLMNGKLGRDEILYVISGEPPVKLMKYFSEKSGQAIHPLEKEAEKLGERKPRLHKPIWRHNLEVQEEERKKRIAAQKEQMNSPASEQSNSPADRGSENIESKSTPEKPKNEKPSSASQKKPKNKKKGEEKDINESKPTSESKDATTTPPAASPSAEESKPVPTIAGYRRTTTHKPEDNPAIPSGNNSNHSDPKGGTDAPFSDDF